MGPQMVVALSWSWRRVRVDPLTGSLHAEDRDRGGNAAELAALEHALRLADELDGRVLAVTVGPVAAEEILRTALAAGAHEAVRIDRDDQLEPGSLAHNGADTAKAIASALHGRAPDLVLCGDRSADGGTGTTPAFLAARLGAAQALGVVKLESNGQSLLAHRRLDGGSREVLRLPRPAVVSLEAAGVRLRRASLPAVLAAQKATIPAIPAEPHRHRPTLPARPLRPRPRELPAPAGATAHDRVLELTGALQDRTPPTVLGPLPAAEAVDELLGYLHRHGYISGETP
ncbi:mycofactocin-associated electron transfer flavoprotein beta subunit [Saccharopolyspora phatthalungensis]|uniref:Electron transfer flavoprotein beta subunit n=1 Tax=Saccharopolyspora phatthalungensis TaxID=664693 RepID=A0A840QE05_9PSEU|nr:mycofactocin-associated electron transfer flavoprotein beta subunit [Saccharopolyspora phatthalungensis]MBB5156799.1 electron transfer flavoprotein beta subunit [Saccharopolyspora phatthalungensis]